MAATQQNATHSRTFRQARRSYSRRRCGSCSVFEQAHSFYKNALNECPFGCGCPPPQLQRSCNITCAKRKYHCCLRQQYHARFACISLACRCGSITKSPFAPALCIAESQKGFTFSFYYFVCSWSILSMTRSTTSNPSPTVSAEKRSGTSW